MLRILRETFPGHSLICDLMSRGFVHRFALAFNQTVSEIGAPIRFLNDSPESLFQSMGYQLVKKDSVIDATRIYGLPVASRFCLVFPPE